eukprot:TRINITY_DN9460_c0_g2_i3.p2 TRINITY_DN9460_c0_g2~~TRINITY_DN9460_c0_g2_i3.p2  ORF type:complete len:109 (+),score=18.24 TRINITY_DN9460_c0_g2_i3:90-416(+)
MHCQFFFFLMIRRPPRSTHCISSAASDVYKRQVSTQSTWGMTQGSRHRSAEGLEGARTQRMPQDGGCQEAAGRYGSHRTASTRRWQDATEFTGMQQPGMVQEAMDFIG